MRNIHQEKIPRELIKKVKQTDNTTQYSKLIHMRGNVEVKMLKKKEGLGIKARERRYYGNDCKIQRMCLRKKYKENRAHD